MATGTGGAGLRAAQTRATWSLGAPRCQGHGCPTRRQGHGGRPGAKAAASRPPPRRGRCGRRLPPGRPATAGGVRSLRRILVLASIVVLLAITLVPTLRSYLHQQGEIEAMRERVASQRLTVEELQKEQARWSDNAYVEQQARERLKFVKVGDRSYTVIDGDPAVGQPAPGVAAAPKSTQDHPWYGQLWESAEVADSGPAAAVRAPVQAPEK